MTASVAKAASPSRLRLRGLMAALAIGLTGVAFDATAQDVSTTFRAQTPSAERPLSTPFVARLLRRVGVDPDAVIRDAFGWRLSTCTFVNNEAARDEVYGDLLSCLYRQLRTSARIGSLRESGLILGEFDSASGPVPFQIRWQPSDLRLRDLGRPVWRAFVDGRAELPLERLLSKVTIIFPLGAPLDRLLTDSTLGPFARTALGDQHVTKIELRMDRGERIVVEGRAVRSGQLRFSSDEDALLTLTFRTDWDPLAGATVSFVEAEAE